MASEPSEENEKESLIERRRWGDGSKVYRRRFYKAQRNNQNYSSPTSAAVATGSTASSAGYSDESSRVFKQNSSQTLEAEDGICSRQNILLRQEEPEALLSKDIARVGQEEGATRDGSVGQETGGEVMPLEIEEVVVPPESREEVVPLESGEVVVAPESREVVVAPGSREVVPLESRKMVPESREAVVALEGREVVPPESVVALESEVVPPESVVAPESSEVAVTRESSEVAVLPESSEALASPESSEVIVLPKSSEAIVARECSDAAVLPESSEAAVFLENREVPVLPVILPESRETVVRAESREVVMLPEGREAVVAIENRGAVLAPHASANGTVEANGVVRPQQQLQLELQPGPPVLTRVEDRVRINISRARSKDEIMELRRELETELDQVRSIFKKLEAKELQLTAYNRSQFRSNMNNNVGMVNGVSNNNSISNIGGVGVGVGVGVGGNFGGYSQPQHVRNDFVERRAFTRVNSEVGSGGHQEARLYSRSLSVSVVENNHGVGEFVEREKRTPKANQFYRNSEFLLGKDRLPPESNKKLKPNGAGRKHGGEGEHGFGFGYDKLQRERVFRSCSSLLQRLMKHKFGWVFNVPVDAKKLGLHDYHDIIRHPMDLGTIKTRLSQNYYKSPKEFAEDVRLVFHNAMTYNPKWQDVHVMAETLLQIFEERWAVIQTEHNPDWRYQMYRDAGLPTPTSRKAPPTQFYTPPIPIPVTPVPQMRTLDRSESMTTPVDRNMKLSTFAHVGRTPVPKKPKAKDLNKRDMTYEEKQKLSTNLQSLPSEKLDAIVQIIKKRNSTLNQHDDEIEVDIDSVDAETLWELDRFVTNYKKNLSKNKRKAEIALQARGVAAQTFPVTNSATAVMDAQKECRIGEINAPPPTQVEKQGGNASRSSSSSSSSSDSGSSSSDSDSDSSSGSDVGRSPAT